MEVTSPHIKYRVSKNVTNNPKYMKNITKDELTYLQKLINLFTLLEKRCGVFTTEINLIELSGLTKEDLDCLIKDGLISKQNLHAQFYYFKWNVCRPNILTVRIFIKRKERYYDLHNNVNEIQKNEPISPYFEVQW